jgi:hypothetical protein
MNTYTARLMTFAPDHADRRLITTHQPADLLAVLESCGIETFLWALRAEPPDLSQRLAVAFAREVLSVWEERHPDDTRPRRAIEAAERGGKKTRGRMRAAARQAEAWAAENDTDSTAADAASAAADAIAAALTPSYAHVAVMAAYASAVAAYADADLYNVIKGVISHE